MLSIIKLRLLRLKDEINVIVLMTVMTLGLTAVFGTSLGSYHPAVLVIDEDESDYSQSFIDELRTNKGFDFIDSDMNSAVKQVEEGNALVGILIKDGFQTEVEAGTVSSLGIIKIKDDTTILAIEEITKSIAEKMAGGIKISKIAAEYVKGRLPEADVDKIKKAAYSNTMESWKYKTPINVTSSVYQTLKNSGYDYMKQTMIGFIVFFSMFTMVFGIGTIISDRQYKTWSRMLISPVSMLSILGGTMAVSYLIGAVQMGVLIIGGKYLFGLDFGSSMAGIIMVSAAYIFTVTSFGLLLSGIVKTQAQLASITPLILTSTSMLGGCIWPLEIVNNKVLLFLAEFTPQKWAIEGLDSIACNGMGFQSAILPTMVLIGMGIVLLGLGLKNMKYEQ